MKQAYLLFTSALIFISAFAASHTTHSSFSSSAANTNNSFSSAASPSIPATPPLLLSTTTPQPGDVVINEVFTHGGDATEWVELFNRADYPIDVSGWKIKDTFSSTSDVFPSVPSISPHGYAIVMGNMGVNPGPSSAVFIRITGDDIGNNLTDNDSLTLKNSLDIIMDQVSFGTDTLAFTLPAPSPNKSIARHPNGVDTDTSADWITNATPSAGLPNP